MGDMVGVLTILGIVLLPAGVIASALNARAFRRRPRRCSVPAVVLSLSAGIALAVASFYVAYPIDPRHRVVGAPFVVAIFENGEAGWGDFVGPFTELATLANAVVALLLPQVVVAALRRKGNQGTADGGGTGTA
jgi:hypothetical protein